MGRTGETHPLHGERLGLNSLTKPIRMDKIGCNPLRTVTSSKTERLDVDQFEIRTCSERAGSLCS